MKRASLNFLAVAGLSLGLFAFGSIKEGGIQGKVTPPEGAKEVFRRDGAPARAAPGTPGRSGWGWPPSAPRMIHAKTFHQTEAQAGTFE